MKKLLLIPFFLAFTGLLQAAQPQKISFLDLQGKVEPYQDPFVLLSEDQLYNLSIYTQVEEIKKTAPSKITEAMKKESEAARDSLIAEKIDIEYLAAQRLAIIEKHKAAALAANPLLANKVINMAGYMLALEFDEGMVTEFLLVANVGACSHKPIPAPNQILLVTLKEPTKASLPYMPIRVTGTLRIIQQSKNLLLVDGKKDVDMTYTLENAYVSPL